LARLTPGAVLELAVMPEQPAAATSAIAKSSFHRFMGSSVMKAKVWARADPTIRADA
jgi:hypothetical protein